MKILITGGAGFIGSHLVEELLGAGHQVEVLDDLSGGVRENLPSAVREKLIEASIAACDARHLPSRLDAIVHLAASPSVEFSWKEPAAAHDNNLSATVRVIEWCRELRIPRLVFASSAAVYGDAIETPLREDHPTAPISPYGLQKLASEQYGRLFASGSGFSFGALRLFNVYGPRQNANLGYAGVLAKFSDAIRDGRDITIHGDGKQTRDFIEVSDVARAFRAACEMPAPTPFFACNVGSGRATTLLEIVRILKTLNPSWTGNVQFVPASTGDIKHSRAGVAQMKERLDVNSRCNLNKGLVRLSRWQASLRAINAA